MNDASATQKWKNLQTKKSNKTNESKKTKKSKTTRKKDKNDKKSDGSNWSDDLGDYEDSDVDFPVKGKAQVGPTRHSKRMPVNEIFRNISAIENDEESPAVFRFQRHKVADIIIFDKGFEEGDLTYAPSRRNPYYMSIERDQMGDIFKNKEKMGQWATETTYSGTRALPEVAIQSYFNVSLKFFHDVANDCVDWLSLSRLIDPQVAEDNDDEKEAKILKQMAFDGLFDYPSNDPMKDQKAEEMRNPPVIIDKKAQTQMLLEDTIEIEEGKIDATWSKEKKKINQEIIDGERRRIYVPIRHQKGWLCWLFLGYWEKSANGRLKTLKNIKKGLAKAWMMATATDPESTAGYRARFSSANLGFPLVVVPDPRRLIRRLGWSSVLVTARFQEIVDAINKEQTQQNTKLEVMEHHPKQGYVKMGENPFNLFTTYVRHDHFNTYMKSLEVVRGQSDTNLKRINATREIETRPSKVKHLKDCLDVGYQPMDEFNKKNQPNYVEAQTTVMSDMKNWTTVLSERGLKNTVYVKDSDFGSTWRIDVGSGKISDARGQRIPKYSPAKIMGLAANEAAEDALGWMPLDKAFELLGHDHRISSGFFMAEWLHLCAFSWGGLTTLSQKGEELYRSSDIPGNLVLGTSETNSVMTRFEKAWQTLVIDSPDLNRIKSCPKLIVRRNGKNEKVVRDVKNAFTGVYSRKTTDMSEEEIDIATSFDFLTYTISYSISFPNGSKLLNDKFPSSLDTTFYPFLRPLYHKLEDQLDKVLYEGMKMRCLNDIQSSHAASMNRALSLNPYNQNGDIATTGREAYGGELPQTNVEYITVVDYGNNPHNLNNN